MKHGTEKALASKFRFKKNSHHSESAVVPNRLTASATVRPGGVLSVKKIVSKRFTDTKIWNDSWYRKMPLKYREAWRFILDNCDNSGVWKVDFDLLKFFVGESFEEADLISHLNVEKQRILSLKNGFYWLVKDFISFQFGELSKDSRVHESILKLVSSHSLSIGYPKGIYTLKDKDKDKDSLSTRKPSIHFDGCKCPKCK